MKLQFLLDFATTKASLLSFSGVVAIDVEAFCQTVAEMHDIKEQAIYLAQRLSWDMSSLVDRDDEVCSIRMGMGPTCLGGEWLMGYHRHTMGDMGMVDASCDCSI